MQKIPTLYERDYTEPSNGRYVVESVITPGCEWVLRDEGVATRKYDGTCLMFDGDEWWARREVKKDKGAPLHFVDTSYDEVTGKRMGYIPVADSDWVKWFNEAHDGPTILAHWLPGTYELCGPKINGNPEGYELHVLIPHAYAMMLGVGAPRDHLSFCREQGWEGIVWHHVDGRMAKLKVKDIPA